MKNKKAVKGSLAVLASILIVIAANRITWSIDDKEMAENNDNKAYAGQEIKQNSEMTEEQVQQNAKEWKDQVDGTDFDTEVENIEEFIRGINKVPLKNEYTWEEYTKLCEEVCFGKSMYSKDVFRGENKDHTFGNLNIKVNGVPKLENMMAKSDKYYNAFKDDITAPGMKALKGQNVKANAQAGLDIIADWRTNTEGMYLESLGKNYSHTFSDSSKLVFVVEIYQEHLARVAKNLKTTMHNPRAIDEEPEIFYGKDLLHEVHTEHRTQTMDNNEVYPSWGDEDYWKDILSTQASYGKITNAEEIGLHGKINNQQALLQAAKDQQAVITAQNSQTKNFVRSLNR